MFRGYGELNLHWRHAMLPVFFTHQVENEMPNILIVDDSDAARSNLRDDLEPDGYKLFESYDGIQAWAFLGKNKNIDLIICDACMPEMSGIDLCQKLHLHPVLKEIPIIILSAHSEKSMKSDAKALGVVAWIVKPYNKKSLLRGIAEVLRKTSNA